MTAGLSISGQSGNLQVDDRFYSYRKVVTGTVYLGVFLHNSNSLPVGNVITFTGTAPLLFFTGGVQVAIVSKSTSGNTHTWVLATGATAGNCHYVIFDASPPTAGNSGLQIFDETGALKFDSSAELMKYVGSYPAGSTLTLPAGRVYAVCLSQTYISYFTFQAGGMLMTGVLASAITVSGDTVNYVFGRFRTIPYPINEIYIDPNYYTQQMSKMRYMVVDIT